MKYREYSPCKALAPYIKCFWTLESAAESLSMRINQDEGKIVYTARIGTKATATPFELISLSADEAVFENPAHPFPQRIRYGREPNGGLFARIEGLDKGKARHEDFPMRRARCE